MDMLVPLYSLSEDINRDSNIKIRRAMSMERLAVVTAVARMFPTTSAWESECEIAFTRQPISCFIAVASGKVVGFCCYDVTFKSFFGPLGVSAKYRGHNLGRILTLRTLAAMREEGYAYSIIGHVADPQFFEHIVNCSIIPDSTPGAYSHPSVHE